MVNVFGKNIAVIRN